MIKFEPIEHTADIGIRAYGEDIQQLFSNAALGMYEQIADMSNVNPTETIEINAEAGDHEELLVVWLSELLYQYNGKNMLLREFSIERLAEDHIVSFAKGEKIDLNKHILRKEVKAVTFHDVRIEKQDGIFKTELIFDV